jgi:hypothetical protein
MGSDWSLPFGPLSFRVRLSGQLFALLRPPLNSRSRMRCRSFSRKARSPRATNAHVHHSATAATSPRLTHGNITVSTPFAPLGNAFHAVLVHWLTIYVSRFLTLLGHPLAVALYFAHGVKRVAELTSTDVLPCCADDKKARCVASGFESLIPPDRQGLLAVGKGHAA